MTQDTHDPRTAGPELWRHMGPQTEGHVSRGQAAGGDRNGGGAGGTIAVAAVVTVAGLAALALMTGRRPPRAARTEADGDDALEVERSLPVAGDKADDLARRFGEAETLATIAGRYAAVTVEGSDRTRWSAAGPLGEWTMRRTEMNGVTRWEAEEASAPLQELSLRVRPARGGRGSVATVGVRGNPPGGFLGRAAAHALGDLLPAAFATGVLYAFKALVETGEVPRLGDQPAGRKQKH
jgi:hypothetical protein